MGMQLTVNATTAAGPFAFVAAIGDVSVGFLNRGLAQLSTGLQPAISQPVTIISQSGTQGPPGIPGPGGGFVGGGGGAQPSFGDFYAHDGVVEKVLDESLHDFSRDAAGTLTVELTCLARVPSGGTGTIAIRIGGTDWAIDGASALTASVTSTGAYEAIHTTGTFTNPTGQSLIKLTLQSSVEGDDLLVKAVEVAIR
jgi:hypothetical protein